MEVFHSAMRFSNVKPRGLARSYLKPAKLTEATTLFCQSHWEAAPVIVAIRPDRSSQPSRCFWNVADKAERDGGEIAFGWAIFEFPSAYREAQHHAVWRSHDGLIDITPPVVAGAIETVFVEDGAAIVDCATGQGQVQDAKWQGEPADEVQNLFREMRRVRSAERAGVYSPQMKEAIQLRNEARKRMLLWLANKTLDTDPCFCGSKNAFQDCCRCNFV